MRSKQLLEELMRFHDYKDFKTFKPQHLMDDVIYDVTDLKEDLDDVKKGFETFLKLAHLGENTVDVIL